MSAITLRILFDAQQTSGALWWDLQPPSDPTFGPCTGALRFSPGDQVSLEIYADSMKSAGLTGFDVLECCIITRPQVIRLLDGEMAQFAQPSPFRSQPSACTRLEGGFPLVPPLGDDAPESLLRQWSGVLQVDALIGRWELSLVLTVNLHFQGQKAPVPRVFGFDPECEVGDGGHPSPRHGGRARLR
ncbi:hypothetical protein [Massilia sp. erpn]|uniref:hypothetical protein n=1 Tax=Massilia sp. erpn TaxID=2738142 RepID=UPI002102F3B6|nr:hypothetical protein [Massilia sp. erpn]UTY56247.1 hypothetical protein HPQ68_03005 [Massilia sp. erpn]